MWCVILFSPAVKNQEHQILIAIDHMFYLSHTNVDIRAIIRSADVYKVPRTEIKGAFDLVEDKWQECR